MTDEPALDTRLRPGVVVSNRYELASLLGTGGMGSVWKARDRSLDSYCALKFIDETMLASDEVRARFEREAKAAAQIRSPHVVDVFEYANWGGRPYIAMEYLEGEELASRLERTGLLQPSDAYAVVAHVSRALMRAHAGGIVHRDLKPENVFLVDGDAGEIAKVLDFGIAKHAAYSLSDHTTKTGSFLGTPYYMSPEQARGEIIDHRTDLWALAVMTFQCLTGRPPFHSDSLGSLLGQIMYEVIPSIRAAAPHLPEPVEAWWSRAIERGRENRFQTAAELSDALGEALGLARISVGGTLFRTSVPSPRQLVPPDPNHFGFAPPSHARASDSPTSRTHHLSSRLWWRDWTEPRRRRAIVAGAAVVVTMAVAAGALSLGRRTPPSALHPLMRPTSAILAAGVAFSSPQNESSLPVADLDADELFRMDSKEPLGNTSRADQSEGRTRPKKADKGRAGVSSSPAYHYGI